MCVAGCFAQLVGDDGLVDAAVSVTGAPNDHVVDIPVWRTDTQLSYFSTDDIFCQKKVLLSLSLLTLGHLPLFAALDALAVVVPGDGGVRQTRDLALQHGLFPLDHLHVGQGLDKVWHRSLLHLALQDLRLLRDGRHLLQLGPEQRKRRGEKEDRGQRERERDG